MVVADISHPEICAGAVGESVDIMHDICAGIEVCPEQYEVCRDILTGGEGKDDIYQRSLVNCPSTGLSTMGSDVCGVKLILPKDIQTPNSTLKFNNLRRMFSEGEGQPAKIRNKNTKHIMGRSKLLGNINIKLGSLSPAPVKRKIEHFENIIHYTNGMEDNFVMSVNTNPKKPRLSELSKLITRVSTGLERKVSPIKVNQQEHINTGMS